ncbi:hypothetical protein, partial [Kaarinaea lacus]
DSKSRTREARLLFTENPALPGSAGELVWEQPSASLPADLLVKRNGKLGVFVLNDGQAKFVPLAGAEAGRPAIVNLAPATEIITQGRFRLQDGDSVIRQTGTQTKGTEDKTS